MEDLDFRLRLLEERYSKVRERMILINQNMIGEFRLFTELLEKMRTEISEMKKELEEVKSVTRELIKTSKGMASKKELAVLEKYINLLSPLNMVTEKEVRKLITEEV